MVRASRVECPVNVLTLDKQVRVIAALVEGHGIRSVERNERVHRDTVMRLGVRVGEACARLHDELVRDLNIPIIEMDEIWTYVTKKQANLREDDPASFGDAYTYVAMDANSKLIIAYLTDKRVAVATQAFCQDVRNRVLGAPQVSTDGFAQYREALELAFGADVHHGVAVKVFERERQQGNDTDNERRYSPARMTRVERTVRAGTPDVSRICTSYVERQNLTMRTHMKRFTRLTNGFSKKIENLRAAVALHFAYYNFCLVHSTLRVTPAMQVGIAQSVWSVGDLIQAALATPERPAEGPPPPPAMPVAVGASRGPVALTVIQGGKR